MTAIGAQTTGILPLADGLARLPGPNGERFAALLAHGTMSVEVYAPRGH